MKKQIGKTMEDKFRVLAEKGFGDDSIWSGGNLWIVFRLQSFSVYVRQFGGHYDTVEAW